jgi:hypothetical protein
MIPISDDKKQKDDGGRYGEVQVVFDSEINISGNHRQCPEDGKIWRPAF